MTPMRPDDVRALARSGALLLGAAVAARLLEWLLASQPVVAAVVEGLLLDVWAQRRGARWTPAPDRAAARAKMAAAAGAGFGLALVAVGIAALAEKAAVSAVPLNGRAI